MWLQIMVDTMFCMNIRENICALGGWKMVVLFIHGAPSHLDMNLDIVFNWFRQVEMGSITFCMNIRENIYVLEGWKMVVLFIHGALFHLDMNLDIVFN